MRMEFTLAHGDLGALGRAFAQEVGERLDMRWRLDRRRPPEARWRCSSRARTTACSTCCGASAAASSTPRSRSSPPTTRTTRPTSRASASRTTTSPVAPAQAESEARCSSCCADVDLVVLARYMQILSGDFLERARRAR